MTKFLLAGLSALMLTMLPLAATSVAAQQFSIETTAECGTGPVLHRYDLPWTEDGDIHFTNSLELTGDDGFPLDTPDLVPVGQPICLAESQSTMHLLNVGYGPGIEMPTKEGLINVILVLEREAMNASSRTYEELTQSESGS